MVKKMILTSGNSLLSWRGLETIHNRHSDIQNDQVRPPDSSYLQQGTPARRGANDLAFGFQELAKGFEQNRMIIGQNDAR
jgi:hypothetical protein